MTTSIFLSPPASGSVVGYYGGVAKEENGTFTAHVSVTTVGKPYAVRETRGHADFKAALNSTFAMLSEMGVK